MRKNTIIIRFFVFLSFFLPCSSFNLSASEAMFNLTPETLVKVVVTEALRSGRSEKGTRVNYRIDENVVDQSGNILIREGAAAYGSVINSRRAGIWGRKGSLDISVEYTTAVDGQKIALRGAKDKIGKGDSGLVIAGAALVAWPLIFIRGSNVVIEPGACFTVYVDDNLQIDTNSSYTPPSTHKLKIKTLPAEAKNIIIMKNGDRISCSIIGLQNGIYSVKTRNGILDFNESDVKSIELVDKSSQVKRKRHIKNR